MKTLTGIWIDSTKALLITLSDNQKEMKDEMIFSEIENAVHHPNEEGITGHFDGNHHINRETKIEERKKQQIKKFIESVISKIPESDAIFIYGPGEMKTKLHQILSQINGFRKKNITSHPADKMSDAQFVALVKKEFSLIGK